ncbi:hypothetical protein pdam_00003781 [Pocillopora damicornis]|uniref:MOSC domain-containing protein n=1 Tax=Pocillopora damicornis TaxID=46731 RepID=A0A3M6T4P3_POCDA|nr:hypothetical protein pdam_00003781 [Pocillopora damicornis]
MVPQSKYLLIGLPVVTLAGIAALWWKQHVKSRSFKEVGSVTGLFVYPVKSCKGNFITQRKDPKLALVVPHFEDGRYLCLNAPGMEMLKLEIQLPVDQREFKRIKIFGMEGEGQYVGDEASEWFSKYMNKPGYKMYKLSRTRVIRTHDEWSDIGEAGDQATFGDFAPYMILAEACLASLNQELSLPLEMERFRPNIVVNGLNAFEEDKWEGGRKIQIGDVVFRYLNNCARCSLPIVNPKTGEKKGEEPLKTLRRIRLPEDRDPRYDRSPLFGINAAPDTDGMGVIRQGDVVMIWS